MAIQTAQEIQAILNHSAEEFAAKINTILDLPCPVRATKANGWFGGYGCRWSHADLAWFTVLPFDSEPLVSKIAEMFRSSGTKSVTITNLGGVPKENGGLGIQIAAHV